MTGLQMRNVKNTQSEQPREQWLLSAVGVAAAAAAAAAAELVAELVAARSSIASCGGLWLDC